MDFFLLLFLAFILDLLFGDPKFIYHPICIIGNLINFLDKILYKMTKKTDKMLFSSGIILFLIVVSFSYLIPFFILNYLLQDYKLIKFFLEVFWCFQILALNSLKKETMKIHAAIQKNDIAESRKFLSYVVGRDTSKLSFVQIIKGTVETISENFSDGVIAPMIYIAIGGAPLGFAYKAVNTLDSIVGYKNEKYLYFGKFSAKMDDVFNFIPARLSAVFMIIGSFFENLDGKHAFKMFIRDRKNHSSPNSAQTESVCSGALNIQLGGDAVYFGKLYKKKTIGDDVRTPENADIVKTNNLMLTSSYIAILFFGIIRLVGVFYGF